HTGLFYEVPDEILRVGILTTINILEWIKNKNRDGKIMFTSSNEAYAGALESFNQLPIPTAEGVPLVISDPYNPRWSYAGTKLIGELLFINYSRVNNFRMSIVSPHNFYGPRAGTGHVIPDFIERILKKENPFYVYGGEDTRSFCYIDDAITQIVAVMETKKTDGETIFLGREKETKIIDLAKTLFDVVDYHPEIIIGRPSPKGSVKRRCPDTTKLYNLTGVKATTSLEDGLAKTFEWYKKNNNPI
ncbi:NAD-dependent epimerase/dehydratase family protein, partial [Patescibacteria group bacterium]|nr:NAD-dependent epimerase/dehydratase family protein [Patescibacteria group bacterium]